MRIFLLLTFLWMASGIAVEQKVVLISGATSDIGLETLEIRVKNDLLKINIPSLPWIINSTDNSDVLDVAIIGGGMAGMSASFALIKEGISNIKIFDENPQDQEGPWIKYARMNVLRSGKRYMGPALVRHVN